MITLKNVKTISGEVITHTIESTHTTVIDGEGKFLMRPTLIDTDALLVPIAGTPKDTTAWTNRIRSYLTAGISTVFDAASCSSSHLKVQQKQSNQALNSSNLPMHVHFYCDGNIPEDFSAIGQVKTLAGGIKISIDLAKKPIDSPHVSSFERLFQLAAQENMIVVLDLIQGATSVAEQRKVAFESIMQAIAAAEKYSAELCVQHVRTKEELALIKAAKLRGILVYIEVAINHLFANTDIFPKDFTLNGIKVFLPTPEDQHALWDEIKDGTVDLIGSAGLNMPPILMMPFLFDAFEKKHIFIDRLIGTTRVNPEAIFRLPSNADLVLIDTQTKKPIPDAIIASYPLLAPWKGKPMAGWPVHVIASGQHFAM